MSAIEQYKEVKHEIAKARAWQAHLSASGRKSECCTVHNIGANPTLYLEYTTSGKKYWPCAEQTSEAFLRRLNRAFARHLNDCIKEAVVELEGEAEKLKAEAMAEFEALFGEALAA